MLRKTFLLTCLMHKGIYPKALFSYFEKYNHSYLPLFLLYLCYTDQVQLKSGLLGDSRDVIATDDEGANGLVLVPTFANAETLRQLLSVFKACDSNSYDLRNPWSFLIKLKQEYDEVANDIEDAASSSDWFQLEFESFLADLQDADTEHGMYMQSREVSSLIDFILTSGVNHNKLTIYSPDSSYFVRSGNVMQSIKGISFIGNTVVSDNKTDKLSNAIHTFRCLIEHHTYTSEKLTRSASTFDYVVGCSLFLPDSIEEDPVEWIVSDTLKRLSTKGNAVLTVPYTFLYDAKYSGIRKSLVDERLLSTIILLPPSLMPINCPNLILLHLQKDKLQSKVKFIDASHLMIYEDNDLDYDVLYHFDSSLVKTLFETDEYDESDFEEDGTRSILGEMIRNTIITKETYNNIVFFKDYTKLSNVDYVLSTFFPYEFKSGYKYVEVSRLISKNYTLTIKPLRGRLIKGSLGEGDYKSSELAISEVPENSEYISGNALLLGNSFAADPHLLINDTGDDVYLSGYTFDSYYPSADFVDLRYIASEMRKSYYQSQSSPYNILLWGLSREHLNLYIRIPMVYDQNTPGSQKCIMNYEEKIRRQIGLINSPIDTSLKKLISEYANGISSFMNYNEACISLVAGIYEMMEDTDNKVLTILRPYTNVFKGNLSDEEKKTLKSNTIGVVDYCLDFYSHETISERLSQISLPSEVLRFCSHYIDTDETLFIPSTGIGQMIMACSGTSFQAYEKDDLAWALAQANIAIHGISGKVIHGCFVEQRQSEKHDNIFMVSSFIDAQQYSIIKSFETLVRTLSDNGKMVALLPYSFCSRIEYADLRKNLAQENMLRAVIALPKVFLPFGEMNAVLILLKKSEDENVLLVDGTSFTTESDKYSSRVKLLDGALLEAIHNHDKRYCIKRRLKNLLNNFDLNPLRYLVEPPKINDGDQVITIGEVVSLKGGKFHHYGSSIQKVSPRVIGYADLKDSFIDSDIDIAKLQDRKLKKYRFAIPNFLYAAVAPTGFRVGKLANIPDDERLLYGHNVFCFSVAIDQDVVREDYILKALTSDYVKKQVQAYFAGGGLHVMNGNDFRQLKLILPSIDKQDEEINKAYRAVAYEANAKRAAEYEEFKTDIRVKKHAIGQNLFTVNNWLNTLQRQIDLSSDNMLDLNGLVGRDKKTTVKEAFCSVRDLVKEINRQVDMFTSGEMYGETEIIHVDNFLHEFMQSNPNAIFSYVYQEHSIKDKNVTISINKRGLIQVLRNIISNACTHGFTGREDNKILIFWNVDFDDVNIYIANNGIPIHKDMDTKRVFAYGESSELGKSGHAGLGAYHSRQIMKHYGADIDIVSAPDNEYTVIYKLTFHNNNIR